ncbi:MAG: WbqC family protein [Chlorobi bacterium]|nr:WbqC family protein [Chlorobiota bacterium]
MKIATIHQPHFLPWLGYFNKLLNSDIFIVLDDVQFRRRYYQNRTDIISSNGIKIKQTVPLIYNKRSSLIKDIFIFEQNEWAKRFLKTITYSYKKSPFYNDFFYVIEEAILNNKNSSLLSLNMRLLQSILRYLDYDIEIVYSSNIKTSNEPTEKLIDLCKATNSNGYIFGEGNGLNYHNLNLFMKNGIIIIKQKFLANHPQYNQRISNFVPGISIIDILFNVDPEISKELILSAWNLNNKI